MKKMIIIGLLLILSIIVSACSNKYVCANGQTVSDPSLCPKQVECYYNYDCGSGLTCLNNNCIKSETSEDDGIRVVECNAAKSCIEGYTCSNTRCVKIQTVVR